MIALMRKLIHNNFYKIFLWVFLIMMGAGSGLVFFREDTKDWVVKAYSQNIDGKKFAAIVSQVKQQQAMFRQRGYKFDGNNVQKEALEAAINKVLMQHAVDQLGMIVSNAHIDREVQKQLQHLPAYFFKENGELNVDAFLKAIAPYSMDDFMSDIVVEAQNNILQGLVDISVYVPNFEKQLQHDADFANKNYSYFMMPFQKYLQQVRKEEPSNEILKKFYKKSDVVEKFRTQEKRSGVLWTFNPTMYIASITDQEIKSFYDKNKSTRFVVSPAQMQVRRLLVMIEPGKEQEAKTKIQEIKQEADKNPSDFESIVKKFSDDKSNANKGGLTELFSKNDLHLDKVVVNTAFEFLGNDGEISAPVKTDRGYELIQRVKKVPAKYKDLAAVSSDIKQELGSEKFKKRFAQDAGRVIQGARYNQEALNAFIERHNGVKSLIPLSVRKPGIEYTHLFKIDAGKYVQFFDKDTGVILLCDTIEKSVIPDFESVQPKVLTMYYEVKAKELMRNQIDLALKDTAIMSFEEVAQKYNASVHQAYFKYNDNKPEQSAILKEQSIQPKLKNLSYQGAVIGIETPSDGIIMRLDLIEKVDKSVTQEQKDQVGKIMFYTKMYQSKEAFVASLYRIAKLNNKIEIKPEILQNTKEV